jgi:hypothetical protein
MYDFSHTALPRASSILAVSQHVPAGSTQTRVKNLASLITAEDAEGRHPQCHSYLILAKAKELPAVFLGFPESQSDNLIKAHWDLHYGAN